MAKKEGLVLEALGTAHTEGPLPELVKARTQAVHHHLISRHTHELLHLTATHRRQLAKNHTHFCIKQQRLDDR